jgi:hypothetical protein
MKPAERIRWISDRLTVLQANGFRSSLEISEWAELKQELNKLKSGHGYVLICPVSGCEEITSDGEPCGEHAALEAEARYGV